MGFLWDWSRRAHFYPFEREPLPFGIVDAGGEAGEICVLSRGDHLHRDVKAPRNLYRMRRQLAEMDRIIAETIALVEIVRTASQAYIRRQMQVEDSSLE